MKSNCHECNHSINNLNRLTKLDKHFMMDEYPPLKTTDRYPSKQREFFIVKRKVIPVQGKEEV